MAITLVTYAEQNVLPEYDASLYDAIGGLNGIISGAEVTVVNNGLHISAGDGILAGRYFIIDEEQISVSLPASGSVASALYIHMDLTDADTPIEIIAGPVPTYVYDRANGIYDLQLATFTATPSGIASLYPTAPKAKTMALQRSTNYAVGDMVFCPSVGAKYVYVCETAGTTAAVEPLLYGRDLDPYADIISDGTADFSQRTYPSTKREFHGSGQFIRGSRDSNADIMYSMGAGIYVISATIEYYSPYDIPFTFSIKKGTQAVTAIIQKATRPGTLPYSANITGICNIAAGGSVRLSFECDDTEGAAYYDWTACRL